MSVNRWIGARLLNFKSIFVNFTDFTMCRSARLLQELEAHGGQICRRGCHHPLLHASTRFPQGSQSMYAAGLLN